MTWSALSLPELESESESEFEFEFEFDFELESEVEFDFESEPEVEFGFELESEVEFGFEFELGTAGVSSPVPAAGTTVSTDALDMVELAVSSGTTGGAMTAVLAASPVVAADPLSFFTSTSPFPFPFPFTDPDPNHQSQLQLQSPVNETYDVSVSARHNFGRIDYVFPTNQSFFPIFGR